MSSALTDMAKGAMKAGASWLVPGSSPFISILDELRSGEYQRRFEERVKLARNKKRAMETASVSHDEEHQHAVISFANAAKVRRKSEVTKEKRNIILAISVFLCKFAPSFEFGKG